MKISIFNPFVRFAGIQALLIGIIAIIFTTVISYFSNIHFPDLISVKTYPHPQFKLLICENLVNWLVPVVVFYLAILIFSPSKCRFIDVAGTIAMARIPYFFAALTGFCSCISKFGEYLMWTSLKMGQEVQITKVEITLAIVMLVVIMLLSIWMIALMYNAFKINANMKTGKTIAVFIPAIIVSIAITIILSLTIY